MLGIKKYVFLVVFIAFTMVVAAEPVITLCASDLMPFAGGRDLNSPGYMVDIATSIFEKRDVNLEYLLVPQKRAIRQIRQGNCDALLAVKKDEAPDLIFPEEEFGLLANTFYVRSDYKWRYNGTSSLEQQNLGGILGHSYGHEITQFIQSKDAGKYVQLLTGKDALKRNLLKLIGGRIDIIVAHEQDIKWGIKQLNLSSDKIVNRGTIGGEKRIYVAFSPKNQMASELALSFSTGIREMRQSGQLKRILEKYNLRDWKPQIPPTQPMKIVFSQSKQPLSLDPAVASDLRSFKVIESLYEGLVQYKDDSTEIEPALAESWEVDSSGTKWVFHLRKNVVFHDGSPFDSDAVVFNFSRQINKQHPHYHEDFSYTDFVFRHINSIEKLNAFTVRVKLTHPYAPFLNNLAMPAARMVSPAATRRLGRAIEKLPVGTGPFKFKKWEKERVELIKFDHYWRQKAYLDQLEFITIEENKTLSQLELGMVDVVGDLTIDQAIDLEANPHTSLVMAPVMQVEYILMNHTRPNLGNVDIRRALNYAINKKELSNKLYKGFARTAKTTIPPSMWGHNSNIEGFPYDPEKAISLLKRAGVNGKLSLEYRYVHNDSRAQLANYIKQYLEAIGIDVVLAPRPWSGYYRDLSKGDYDLALSNWYGDNGDPDNFFYVLLDKNSIPTGSNRAFFSNDQLHELLVLAQSTLDREKRALHYKAAEKIVHAQAPWILLFHAQQLVGRHNKIRDIIPHPTGTIRFHRSWIER